MILKLGDALKLVAIFRSKGLLTAALQAVIKDALLAARTGVGQAANEGKGGEGEKEEEEEEEEEVIKVCGRYDLDALSEPQNLDTLLALHEELEAIAQTRIKELVEPLFNEASLTRGHQGASQGAVELSKILPRQEPNKEYDSRCFIYGEIEFDSFTQILAVATNSFVGKKGKFVDLGSGMAKAVLWTSLVSNFDRLVGIEINPLLFDLSRGIVDSFEAVVNARVFLTPAARAGKPTIDLHLGSFLDLHVHDWTDANLAFANSAAFTDGLMKRLSKCARLMKTGSRFITLTTKLPDDAHWKVIYKDRHDMSWGAATVWVQQRL